MEYIYFLFLFFTMPAGFISPSGVRLTKHTNFLTLNYKKKFFFDMKLSQDVRFASKSVASNCLLHSKDDSSTLSSICDSKYNAEDIIQTLGQKDIQKIHIDCSGKKTFRHRQTMSNSSRNVCICLEIKGYSYFNGGRNNMSNEMISSYNPGCINHTITLTREHFKGQKYLKALVLAHVPLYTIAPNSFDDLASLQFVSLLHNTLGSADLPSGLFCKNSMLQKLHLQGVDFTEFPSHLFVCEYINSTNTCLPRLNTVIIQDSAITVMPQEPFGCAKNITSIWLPRNKITGISNLCNDTGRSLQKLEILSLPHNHISELSPYIFRHLPYLSRLELSYNLLKNIEGSWFEGASLLTVLLLDNNFISNVDGSLASLPLTHLSLGYNSLRTLPLDFVNGSNFLIWLDLQANELNDLAAGSLEGLRSLWYFNASANDFTLMGTIAKAFRKPAVNLAILLLQNNNVQELDEISLSFCPVVKLLVLNNNNIRAIHESAFSNLPMLDTLYLESNSISRITRQFSFLKQMFMLYLTNNQITNLHTAVFEGLPNLQILGLGNNNISSIRNNTFNVLTRLKELHLDKNCIDHIEKNAFSSTLENLYLGDNRLTAIPCMEYNNNLRLLSLHHNNISSINRMSFCNVNAVELLDLRNNIIDYIEPGSFLKTTSLMTIALSWNRLNLDFSVNYFEGAPLNDVHLVGNEIHSAENLFFHEELRSAQKIHLDKNPIKELPGKTDTASLMSPAILVLSCAFCNISSVDESAFSNLGSVESINLMYNQIKDFPNMHVSKVIYNTLTINLRHNPIECSCKMKWLKNNESLLALYDFVYCTHPVNYSLVFFTKVPLDEFVCKTNYLCDNSMCTCFSDNVGYYPTIANCSERHSPKMPKVLPEMAKVIYLHGNNYNNIMLKSTYPQSSFQTRKLTLYDCNVTIIQTDTFIYFRFLEELYLHNNQIQHLPEGLFVPLTLLKVLTLHDNCLLSLNNDFLLHNNILQVLKLHNNSLSVLTQETRKVVSEMFYLLNLTLHENPWICTCDNMSWKSWLSDLDAQQKLGNVQDIRCEGGSSVLTTPDEVFVCRNYSMTSSQLNDGPILATGLLVGLLLIVCITMGATFYHRHFFAILIFSIFGVRIRRQKETEGCEYDVILLFDDEDYFDIMSNVSHIYEWMINLNTPYKVMMPAIHIDGGACWASEISKGIHLSKRSVAFVTQDFFLKGRTMFLFDTAYGVTVDRRSSDLMLVLDNKETLSYLKSGNVTDQRLKALLRTGNYLMFNDKHFHKKLLYFLPGDHRRSQRHGREDRIPVEEI